MIPSPINVTAVPSEIKQKQQEKVTTWIQKYGRDFVAHAIWTLTKLCRKKSKFIVSLIELLFYIEKCVGQRRLILLQMK